VRWQFTLWFPPTRLRRITIYNTTIWRREVLISANPHINLNILNTIKTKVFDMHRVSSAFKTLVSFTALYRVFFMCLYRVRQKYLKVFKSSYIKNLRRFNPVVCVTNEREESVVNQHNLCWLTTLSSLSSVILKTVRLFCRTLYN